MEEVDMRTEYVVVYLLVIALALAAPLSAGGDESLNVLEEYYSNLIDEAIAHCELKNRMRDSWSKSVRRTAAVAYLKGAYFREYKKELVNDMIEEGVGKKAFKVNYYLNKRFYSVVNKAPEYIVKR
jgi:hypothetical protein